MQPGSGIKVAFHSLAQGLEWAPVIAPLALLSLTRLSSVVV